MKQLIAFSLILGLYLYGAACLMVSIPTTAQIKTVVESMQKR